MGKIEIELDDGLEALRKEIGDDKEFGEYITSSIYFYNDYSSGQLIQEIIGRLEKIEAIMFNKPKEPEIEKGIRTLDGKIKKFSAKK